MISKSKKALSFNSNNNLITYQIKTIFTKIPFMGNEVLVYDKKQDSKEYLDVPNFTNDFLGYNSKYDYKVNKDKLILPRNMDLDFPYILYESPGRPGFLILSFVGIGIVLNYIYKWIKTNFIEKKYNPEFSYRYLVSQIFCLFGILFFIKMQMKIIRKISINNLNVYSDKLNNGQKNLTIKLYSGKIINCNISDIWFDKPVSVKSEESKFLRCNIKEDKVFMTFKNSKIYDRALFMNIARGNQFRFNK